MRTGARTSNPFEGGEEDGPARGKGVENCGRVLGPQSGLEGDQGAAVPHLPGGGDSRRLPSRLKRSQCGSSAHTKLDRCPLVLRTAAFRILAPCRTSCCP